MTLTAEQVVSYVDGALFSGSPDTIVEGVSIDSRRLQPGDLFFAIRGENHDGHDFLDQAIAGGACGLVLAETRSPAPPVFSVRVSDTTLALQELACAVRRQTKVDVVAITGSMGKTTTKEAAAAAIATGYRVLRSEGNLNNHYGLPLSLLRLLREPDDQVAVLEMGMSAPGEIARLTEIAEPNIGLLTNVAEVHLEFFSSVEAIAAAKGELLVGLAEDSIAVVNADDPLVLEQARRFSGRQIRFGIGSSAELRARGIRSTAEGLRFQAEYGAERAQVASSLHGRHNVYNLLAGLAAARALELPLQQAASGLSEVTAPRHRGERIELASGILLIDETYNSNPRALEASMAMLVDQAAHRHVAVLGDMRELGAQTETIHREAGARIAERHLSLLVGVGPLGSLIVEGARDAGMPAAALAVSETAEQAGELLAERLRPGDRVLLKASRSVGLERAIASLEQKQGEE